MEKLTSRKNPVCMHLKKLGTSKSYRDKFGEFLCDGEKLLLEAVTGKVCINTIISPFSTFDHPLPLFTNVYLADVDLINSISPLKSPGSLVFSCKIPEAVEFSWNPGTYILLDNIQDPGNVGTIIRTALAFNISGILLTGNPADIYNPKTIRASAGAVFKQPIYYLDHTKLIELKRSSVRFLGASSSRDSTSIKNTDLKNTIIVMGNEGYGISEGLAELCDDMFNIPLNFKSESLNVAVAASIIMWEAKNRG